MTMQIEYELNWILGHYFLNLCLNVDNLRMLRFLFSFPVSIQIMTHSIAPITSQKYSVYIDHWDYVHIKPP